MIHLNVDFMFAVCKVLGLEKGKECVIVGTLFKHMKLKPCVLDEYSKEVGFYIASFYWVYFRPMFRLN